MEDVLDTLAKPAHPDEPVVAWDERPVELLDSKRPGRGHAPGQIAHRDYEYVRKGVANVFCIVAPHEGRHLTHATKDRKAPQFAKALKKVARAYPTAKKVHLIVDNLNTHTKKSLVTAFGETEGNALWSRFEVHCTPKHGSWLNPAEIEVGQWSRECLGRDRLCTLNELRARTSRWNADANRRRRRIRWRFRTPDARRLFGYRG